MAKVGLALPAVPAAVRAGFFEVAGFALVAWVTGRGFTTAFFTTGFFARGRLAAPRLAGFADLFAVAGWRAGAFFTGRCATFFFSAGFLAVFAGFVAVLAFLFGVVRADFTTGFFRALLGGAGLALRLAAAVRAGVFLAIRVGPCSAMYDRG
ncbi:MAG: hypothetical protein KIT10_01245 [Flavobacteriales bacterium]|nr:hypothetical protein [Flavobacteriales bacterium]